MSIDIQRNTHVRMSHQILQSLNIHTLICHIRTERMAEHMRGNMRQGLFWMQLLIFLHRPPHFILDMQRHFRMTVFVNQNEAAVPVHDNLRFHFPAIGKDIFQTLVHIIGHWNEADTALGLGFFHIVFAATFPDKLMIHTDSAIFKVKIALGQSAKFTDTHPSSQQHDKFIIILAVGLILPNEVHPDFLLLVSHGNTLLRIIGNNIYQFEIKRIFSDNIFVISHLKRRFDNAPDACNRAVPLAVAVELHNPLLGIRYFNIPNLPVSKILFLNQVQYKIVPDFGVISNPLLQTDIAFQ